MMFKDNIRFIVVFDLWSGTSVSVSGGTATVSAANFSFISCAKWRHLGNENHSKASVTKYFKK